MRWASGGTTGVVVWSGTAAPAVSQVRPSAAVARPREPIDRAVLEYFTQVALDVEGTLAQLTGERDRRLADLDTKLEHARSVQADAERQLERLDGLLQDEG